MSHDWNHLKNNNNQGGGGWLVVLISNNNFIRTTLGIKRVVYPNNISGNIHRCPARTTYSLASEEAFKKISALKVGFITELDGSNGLFLIDVISGSYFF